MKKVFLFILSVIGILYSSDFLTINGKIVDTLGVGIENVKIISEDDAIAYTNINGEYTIDISKDVVPIDNLDMIIKNYDNYLIKIYDILGQKIFEQSFKNSDFSDFIWNGINKDGERVASGIYFSILEINNNIVARNKITILGLEVLNKRPFINTSAQQINISSLLKTVDYNYDTILSFESKDYINIYNKTVKIDYNGNNDNCATAEEIVLYNYENYVIDIDGNIYQTVEIGNQEWMVENLKVTRYRNGKTISDCWAYDNDESNVEIYGKLYSWYEVNKHLSDDYSIAPEGWHVPNNEEWEELAQYISDDNGGYSNNGEVWINVGKHLKSTTDWILDGNGTDDYGFNALPAGHRNVSGNFTDLGTITYFWHASDDVAWMHCLFFDSYNLFLWDANKGYGYSVRCVKD